MVDVIVFFLIPDNLSTATLSAEGIVVVNKILTALQVSLSVLSFFY